MVSARNFASRRVLDGMGDVCLAEGMRPRSAALLWLSASAAAFMLAGSFAALADPCALPANPGPTVNVRDKGARGDGQTDDTAALQRAIDAVSTKGGTVVVPDGIYMLDAVSAKRVKLKSGVALKLSPGATLKVIPNAEKHYQLLTVEKVSQVTITGGTLEGDRAAHTGVGGEWGMGLAIVYGASHVTVSGTTVKNMWGDGFYVEGANDVALCGVTADHNRRQGLSIIDGVDITVTGSTFSNTRGTDPSAGIDLEPDKPTQRIVRVRIERSKFLNNAGPGVLIAAQKKVGNIADVSIANNYFSTTKPIKIKYAPAVLDSAICNNRYVVKREQSNDITTVATRDEYVTVTAPCGDQGIRIRQ